MYKKERIKNYEEYSVDTNGIVYSKKGIPLKSSLNHKGYCIVNLIKDGKRKGFAVHTLVARQFLENIENKPTINHKNGNKTDNCIDNLEWATYKEQTIHKKNVLGYIVGGFNSKSIKGYDKNTNELIYEFSSIAEAGRFFSKDKNYKQYQNSIYRNLSGKRKSYMGCVWKYS